MANSLLRAALEQIIALRPHPFEMPPDWQDQIAACAECQRYAGHPIQQGICDEHRRPLWARAAHQDFEEKAIGPRAAIIAADALAAASRAHAEVCALDDLPVDDMVHVVAPGATVNNLPSHRPVRRLVP